MKSTLCAKEPRKGWGTQRFAVGFDVHAKVGLDLMRLITEAGREPFERDTLYRPVTRGRKRHSRMEFRR